MTTDDEEFIVDTAEARLAKVGALCGHWRRRKLRRWLGENPDRPIVIPEERLRQTLGSHQARFERTKTCEESGDPDKEAKLGRIDTVIVSFPDRTFAFDEFAPLALHPIGGRCWAPRPDGERIYVILDNLGAQGQPRR